MELFKPGIELRKKTFDPSTSCGSTSTRMRSLHPWPRS